MSEILQKICFSTKDPRTLPMDSITQITWHPEQRLNFGVTSFDGFFRIYKIFPHSNSSEFTLSYFFKYPYPLTCFCFIKQSNLVLIGTAEGKVILIDLSSSNEPNFEYMVVQSFSSAIQRIYTSDSPKLIICIDMSITIKIFNMTEFKVVQEISLKEEIQDSDFKFPLLIVALSNNKLFILDLNHPNK